MGGQRWKYFLSVDSLTQQPIRTKVRNNVVFVKHNKQVEVQMSLHQLAGISPSHPGSLSCLLYIICMLAIPFLNSKNFVLLYHQVGASESALSTEVSFIQIILFLYQNFNFYPPRLTGRVGPSVCR